LEELVGEGTRELRESEEKYRELFEACPVSLWEEDFSAVKQFLDELRQKGVSDFGAYLANHPKEIAKCAALVKVLNMNKATLNLYGAKSVDEIIGGLSGVLTEESDRAFVDEIVALVQGKYYEAEFENRTLRGETKHCNVICTVVAGYEQSLAKVLVCIVDLTPQKKLEAELVKSQQIAAIGETAAMVGHDLRNPLQGIAGATYNIRRHFRNALDPSTKEMLAVIDNGVQYANGIVNDLLEFSREMQLQLLPTTAKSIVRKTLADVKVPNNIIIEDMTADAPEILVDEPKLRRALTNLIGNAIDAMPEGGKLSIYSKNTQKDVSISVRDTGFGIPKEMVDKIWTPLHSTKARGIGLGLPICRRIIEAHRGSISVESTVGKGTTFTLELPIQNVQTGGEPL
jgi:signal transduction histidine kinase